MTKETNFPPFGEEGLKVFQQFNPFKQYKFPQNTMEPLFSCHQKNMELMTHIQQLTTETTKSIMDRQNEYFKGIFEQCSEHLKYYGAKSPLEKKTTHHAEISKELFDKTIEHLSEFNSTLTQSNKQIIELFQTRFQEGLNESATLVKNGKEKN